MKQIYEVLEDEFDGPKGDKLKLVIKHGKTPSDLKERKIPRSPAPEALEFIINFLPEFKRIWKAITDQGPLNKTTVEQQKQAALTCFYTHSDWKYICEDALKSLEVYDWEPGREKRDFRGRLIQELLTIHFIHLPKYGYQLLGRIAKELETD